MLKRVVKKSGLEPPIPWSTMHRMETGASYEADAAGRRRATRRRRQTTACATLAALSLVCWLVVRMLVTSALVRARAKGEECWPLAGRHVSAVVLAQAPPKVLWFPRYIRDESPGDVIRAHERSVLCPALKTRIRPKRVNVSYTPWRHVALSDKAAVCVTHYTDYFTTGKC
jgi:hypothetical protein